MAVRKPRPVRPVDAAITRLLALAGRGAAPGRMAREVEVIAGEWLAAPDCDRMAVRAQLDELREQLVAGVGHAEEQVADLDASEAGAMKQAGAMLAALVATRDAATRALRAV
ncbi:hypothetical protein [Falsiroseomonas selenitidurans]|uniref:Uncharacterized protein n=1 Tax=Falsiroseomonas selenitidurans TaxID=2716335 RepID=A0ABX1DZ80_9PROT|nr:hypothetical protein [Falsiroseomonas selenitidurans]NKC30156.1 hypothetical protein [Falsiroseomonas selenitidurans]